MPTYRLTLEYDGTRYHGWQGQEAVRTVSGEVLRAAQDVAAVLELGGAGRTDAGVHAAAQTAHLRLKQVVEPVAFRDALNDRLPPDIHVLSVTPALDQFHARHQALSRSYVYQISTRRTAFGKRFVWWVRTPLDRAEMLRAAALFVGRHDFSRFCERPTDQTSTLVEVERIEVSEDGDLVLVRLVASHFLWKMVRRVVGTLVRIGSGEIRQQVVADLLDPKVPVRPSGSPAQWTAPASGLFLERVLYDGDPPLPALKAQIPVRTINLRPAGRRAPATRDLRPRRAPRRGKA